MPIFTMLVFAGLSAAVHFIFGGEFLGAPAWAWGFMGGISVLGWFRLDQALNDKHEIVRILKSIRSQLDEAFPTESGKAFRASENIKRMMGD